MMKASELVSKALSIAKNRKTLYVMGCFGAPMTAANKKRYTTNHSYNKAAARVKMINAASADTFGFDCVCLIKGILWGWNGDQNKTYGGAVYASNGVPDIGADQMITKCPDASTTGWASMEPGEVVWTTGHIGIYIGDGLAVECTPKWDNCVQVTAVANIGSRAATMPVLGRSMVTFPMWNTMGRPLRFPPLPPFPLSRTRKSRPPA